MKTFIVLGMHRSATSLIAKGLVESGVYMGDQLLGAHSSNSYGHYEDVDFIALNDEMLKKAGGSWNNPPLESEILKLHDVEIDGLTIQSFIAQKQKEPFWGWKDPRTVLTIKLFLPYLENPHFITCFRDPREVARSLAKRDLMTRNKALVLAKIYNDRLLRFLNEWASDKYQL